MHLVVNPFTSVPNPFAGHSIILTVLLHICLAVLNFPSPALLTLFFAALSISSMSSHIFPISDAGLLFLVSFLITGKWLLLGQHLMCGDEDRVLEFGNRLSAFSPSSPISHNLTDNIFICVLLGVFRSLALESQLGLLKKFVKLVYVVKIYRHCQTWAKSKEGINFIRLRFLHGL
ncbi:hypothetical protein VNO80_20655 [Phaseolus coccineus]|uniref:Uncharacterized protein n=1 Tax=Phaseolus coccineus TaxID=3886 RepID=A0AAN9M0Y5_PHACN